MSAAPSALADPFLVYKVSKGTKSNFWIENRSEGTASAGTINVVRNAFVIQDTGDLTQIAILIDSKKRTYQVGAVGQDLEFLDEYGADPFLPGVEVIRTFHTDSKGRMRTFWSYWNERNGDVIVDADGNVVRSGSEPLMTTARSFEMQSATGSLKTLDLGLGADATYTAPSTMSGNCRRILTDPRHAIFRYNPAPAGGGAPGIEEALGSVHVEESGNIKFSFQASLTKLLNSGEPLLDDLSQPVPLATQRYAVLALLKYLEEQKFTPAK